eukprot:4634096-Alexandrium_andersonii.AAC.1
MPNNAKTGHRLTNRCRAIIIWEGGGWIATPSTAPPLMPKLPRPPPPKIQILIVARTTPRPGKV